MTILRIAIADIWADGRRTLLSLAAIVPTVIAYLLLLGVAAGLAADRGGEPATNIVVLSANVLDPASGRLDPSVPSVIESAGGQDVTAVSPVIFRPILVDDRVLQLRATPLGDWQSIHGLTLLEGSWPAGEDEIAVTEGVTTAAGWDIGTTAGIYGDTFTVSAVVRASGTKFASVWMPYERAERLFGGATGFQMAVVQTLPGSNQVATRDRLAAALGDDVAVFFESEIADDQASRLGQASSLAVLATAIGVTALAFGVFNLSAVSLAERTRDVGIMRAVGFRRRTIASFVALRVALVALAGYIIGAGLAAAFFATRPPQTLRSFVIEFGIPWQSWIIGALLTTAVAAAGALLAQLPLAKRSVLSLLDAS